MPGRAAERVGGAWGAREGRVGPKSDLPRTLARPIPRNKQFCTFGTIRWQETQGAQGAGRVVPLRLASGPPCQWAAPASAPGPAAGWLGAPGHQAPRDAPRGPPPPPSPRLRPVTSQSPVSGRSAPSAFTDWLARQTAPLPPRPRSPGERCWGGRWPEGRSEPAPRA